MDAGSWDDRYAKAKLVWSAEPNQFFAEEVAPLTPEKALDLGTGEGRNAIWLAEQGWNVTALDFSSVAIEKARAIAQKRGVVVEWVVADLVAFEPEPASFDLVAVVYIHLPASERSTVVRRAASAVATGGSLLVIGHDSTNLPNGVGGPQNPDVLFTPDDIVADIGDLRLVRAERMHRIVAGPDGDAVAIDAVIMATRA